MICGIHILKALVLKFGNHVIASRLKMKGNLCAFMDIMVVQFPLESPKELLYFRQTLRRNRLDLIIVSVEDFM